MNKVKKLILIVICLSLVLTTRIYASSLGLQTDIAKKSLYPGDEFVVKLKLVNVDSKNKIYGIQGKLKYDDAAIESIGLEGLNNWSATYNNETDNELKGTFVLANFTEGTNTEKEVAKLYIKMKPNIEFENTQINITDVYTSNEIEEIKVSDVSIDIEILERQIQNSNGEENSSNNNQSSNEQQYTNNSNGNTQSSEDLNNNIKSSSNDNSSTNKKNKSNVVTTNKSSGDSLNKTNKSSVNTSNKKTKNASLPKLGMEDNIKYFIFILIIVSIMFLCKYKKYKNI